MANLNDQCNFKGEVTLTHYNEKMEQLEQRVFPNLVVTTGRNYITSRMKDAVATPMTHLSIGNTNTAPAITDTTLYGELGRSALTSTTVTTNSITGVGTGSLVEAGIFNAASAGTMLARCTYGTVTKTAGDTVIISWTISNI
jgi:hypothetical protein